MSFYIDRESSELSLTNFLDSWRSAHVLATFLVGLAFLGGLAIHQSAFKRNGMFHHDLFRYDCLNYLVILLIFE